MYIHIPNWGTLLSLDLRHCALIKTDEVGAGWVIWAREASHLLPRASTHLPSSTQVRRKICLWPPFHRHCQFHHHYHSSFPDFSASMIIISQYMKEYVCVWRKPVSHIDIPISLWFRGRQHLTTSSLPFFNLNHGRLFGGESLFAKIVPSFELKQFYNLHSSNGWLNYSLWTKWS